MVVPVNPMNLTNELRHYMTDSGAKVAFAAQELYPRIQPLLGEGLDTIVVASYSDYLEQPTDLHVPDFVKAPRAAVDGPGRGRLGRQCWQPARSPRPMQAGADDLAVMPYTSGTTGQPKGCMHSHRTTMYNAVAGGVWTKATGGVGLAVLPMFHVTGMQYNLNGAIYNSGTVVLLPRWDRDAAAICVQRYGVTGMALITAMVIDFMANPKLGEFDLSSLRSVGGGGAAMPRAVALAMEQKLGPEVPRRLRHVGDDGRDALQPARAAEGAVPGRAAVRRRCARGRARRHRGTAARRDRRDHRARPAGDAGLLEPAAGHGRSVRRDRRQAVPAHRRPRRTWTRRATSSSSTGSSG